MALNYAALAATAQRLITDNGQTVTVNRPARGAYDPAAGFSGSVTTYSCEIVMLDEPKKESPDSTKQNEEQLALCYSATLPLISDTCTINGKEYRFLSVKTVQPATTVVYYEIRLSS